MERYVFLDFVRKCVLFWNSTANYNGPFMKKKFYFDRFYHIKVVQILNLANFEGLENQFW